MRVNWRSAWSYFDKNVPIAYKSEPALSELGSLCHITEAAVMLTLLIVRYPYTKDTYNNPQNLWKFAASKLLH
jgi:hypothetical protein